jgi:chromosome segregation ATPase
MNDIKQELKNAASALSAVADHLNMAAEDLDNSLVNINNRLDSMQSRLALEQEFKRKLKNLLTEYEELL